MYQAHTEQAIGRLRHLVYLAIILLFSDLIQRNSRADATA
jgi:hypothetical protein